MTPEEFREALKEKNLSIDKAAKLLGVSRRMVFYYLNGTYKISKTIQRVLKQYDYIKTLLNNK